MRPIDKFILHVVHNLFPLNEYSEGELKKLMAQFREEADDLGIEITDDQLKAYIQRFDALKNSPKVTDKDLRKYSLSKLIKLVTSSKGAETPDEAEDQTPDVVYQENGITVWNGSKEGNCINYGAGEKWCITRGSFGSYRYSSERGFPTFYLAKNNNISQSDKNSFVAIQVRDNRDEDRKYVYTDRSNSPYESNEMSFGQLVNKVSWLNDIPNLRSILKYIPLSSKEKASNVYKNNAVSVREWTNLPFETKKQYLVIRGQRGSQLFTDIDNEVFVAKYLPKYPQLAEFVAITPGIIDSMILLQNLDKFSNQDRKSITANLRGKISTKYLNVDVLSFDVKKLLTILNKWDIGQSKRLYVTKDGSTIVELTLGDNIKVGLYQAEDDYPNVKLNKRTSKYLLDYPELDQIPLRNLIKLVQDEVIDKSVIDDVLEKAKTDSDSAIIVKDNIILDSNSFASYKIEGDKITQVPFDDEDVQAVFNAQKDNEGFQQNAIRLINDRTPIPETIDKDAFISLLKATPLDKRIIEYNNTPCVVLVTQSEEHPIVVQAVDRGVGSLQLSAWYGDGGNWRRTGGRGSYSDDPEVYRAWFSYLRQQNRIFTGDQLVDRIKAAVRNTYRPQGVVKAIVQAEPPLEANSNFLPTIYQDKPYLVNQRNPRDSYGVSDATGKLVKANIPTALAARMLGTAAPAALAQATGRRGRPAGQPNTPQAAAVAPAAGDINVGEEMQNIGLDTAFLRLPRSIIRRLNVTNASRVAPNGDRGAARRNNQLGGRGTVGRVISVGASKIYIIRLANQQIIASVNVQPGNYNYILTGNAGGNNAISLNSPSDLVQVLTQRGLAEIRRYITKDYLHAHPEQLDEVKNMLTKHLDEISVKQAMAAGALSLGLMGTPSLAKSQNTLGGKIGNFIKKIQPTVKVDTVKVQKDTPLLLAKFKDHKGAGYGHAKSPNESTAYKIAKQNATQDLLSKIGQQRIVAGIEEKAVKHYINPDGTHEYEVLLVVGNI
jgi:hypothetical protein